MFEGSGVALVTPMSPQGAVDETALEELVEWHISEGTQALVIMGTTGECATVSWQERENILRCVVERVRHRIPVVAGTGTHATQSTIDCTRHAKEMGADACMIVTPYYNRPTQAGLLAHFRAIVQAVSIPIVLYNIPSRTACDLLPETVGVLSALPEIIGIKEGTGCMERLEQLKALCRPGFRFYSGDDMTALSFLQRGGCGVISVAANCVPRAMQGLCHWAREKPQVAERLALQLKPLYRMCGIETNPIPVKWALYRMQKIANSIRLPLVPLSSCHHIEMDEALAMAQKPFSDF